MNLQLLLFFVKGPTTSKWLDSFVLFVLIEGKRLQLNIWPEKRYLFSGSWQCLHYHLLIRKRRKKFCSSSITVNTASDQTQVRSNAHLIRFFQTEVNFHKTFQVELTSDQTISRPWPKLFCARNATRTLFIRSGNTLVCVRVDLIIAQFGSGP